ncbi:MAG: hypothetical protein ACRDPT_13745, partial [Streptomycetales bacterium]
RLLVTVACFDDVEVGAAAKVGNLQSSGAKPVSLESLDVMLEAMTPCLRHAQLSVDGRSVACNIKLYG